MIFFLENYDLDNDLISDKSDTLKDVADIIEKDFKNGKIDKNKRDTILNTMNTTIKSISSLDNKEKLKDPNFIVKIIKWFRSIYRKILIKLDGEINEDKAGFLKRLCARILAFIDKLMMKLQTLVDRRTGEQISARERLSFERDAGIINNINTYKTPKKYKFSFYNSTNLQ